MFISYSSRRLFQYNKDDFQFNFFFTYQAEQHGYWIHKKKEVKRSCQLKNLSLITCKFAIRITLVSNQFINSSIHQFINSSIHQFINSSIHQFINSSIHQFFNSLIHQFINSSIHQFINS